MSIKMRVLYYSKKGKMETLANAIAKKYELEVNKVDTIPPAYSCDKERIVILGLTVGDNIPDQLRLFCRELTKERAHNVAIFIDGPMSAADKVKAILKEAGTNVIDEVLLCRGGLPFKFIKNISDAEKADILEWADRVVNQLA